MPELAVLIPTRGRPENIRKVISAWDFTNAWDVADMIVVADADDPEIGAYRSIVAEDDGLPAQLVVIPSWLPMVHKLDVAAREAASRYWAVAFAGDDHLPQTINWAKTYLAQLHELGSGMVYGDDGYQGVKLSTEWAVTSDVVRALGRMVPAPVEHMYCDNAMMDLFTAAGALRHLPQVRIEHMHPVAGKAASDEQYKRVNGREQFARDRAAYEGWQRTELASQAAIVRELRAGRPDERAPRPIRPANRRGGTMSTRPPRFFKRVQGATPEDILITLADFAAQVPADQEIVELGVFQGRTALQMAWGARQGQGAHVTAIDPWALEGNVYDPPFTEDASRRWAAHWVQSLGYSRDITLINDFSHNVARSWTGQPVGLLYVDGDHTKEGARRDIEAWAEHLAPGARIAVDDYGHPDWPGVGEALDELVAEGVLDELQVFHDRLAVTKLATGKPERKTTAITSEGVHPSPYPAVDGQVADGPEAAPEKAEPPVVARHTEAAPVRPTEDVELPAADTSQSTHGHHGDLSRVGLGEALVIDGTTTGQPVDELKLDQLRALARHREIVLGARKDKKAEIIQALKDGR